MIDCSDGSIPGDYRMEWKKLSAKRKLYLKFGDAELYVDDGSGEKLVFFKYGREKRRFCLEAFGKNVFGEPCYVKDCGCL